MSSITPWNEAPSVLSVFNRGGGGSAHLYQYMKYQCACIIKSLAVASFVNVIKSYQYQANQFHNMCWITNTKGDIYVHRKYLVTGEDFQKIRHKIVMPFLHLSFCPNPVDGSSCYVRQFEWIPVSNKLWSGQWLSIMFSAMECGKYWKGLKNEKKTWHLPSFLLPGKYNVA